MHVPVYSEDSCQITSAREKLFIVERQNKYSEGARGAPVVWGESSTRHVNELLPHAGVYRLFGGRRHNDTGARRVTLVLQAPLSEKTDGSCWDELCCIRQQGPVRWKRPIGRPRRSVEASVYSEGRGRVLNMVCSPCAEDGGGGVGPDP